jgi:pimeloyl-ACP methyl ester carboxylesterase
MAGHSFGGLYVMAFAARYPGEVAGMVLVDSTAPATTPAPSGRGASYDVLERVSAMVSASARLGLGRVVGRLSYSSLPPQSRDEARASAATASQMGSTVDEYGVAAASTREAGGLVDLGGRPLIVLTAGRGHDEEWMSAQDEMATLSTNSLHRVVAGATHASLIENRDDANAVSQAVHDVVASVRSSAPLVGP